MSTGQWNKMRKGLKQDSPTCFKEYFCEREAFSSIGVLIQVDKNPDFHGGREDLETSVLGARSLACGLRALAWAGGRWLMFAVTKLVGPRSTRRG